MKLNGFDRIAFIYDFLAKLVFGKSIKESQQHFLNKIEDSSKVLILGGGTGWLLAELLKVKPNCEIWYIDASQRMIALSKSKIDPKLAVHFIHGTERDIPSFIKCDVLITNFYFDLFTYDQLKNNITRLQSSTRPGGRWIVTDFVNNEKWWQVIMLKAMYWFFRIACNIESQRLPEWSNLLEKAGVKEIDSKPFCRGFIKAALYQF